MKPFEQKTGLTVLEVLIVLAVLGALLLMGLPRADPRQLLLERAAQELQVFLQRARLEAIRRNAPVLVQFAPDHLQTCLDRDRNGSCGPQDGLLQRWSVADYGGIRYHQNFPTQLLWSPDGLPRQTGTGFAAGHFELRKEELGLRVVMSAAGRFRTEPLPP